MLRGGELITMANEKRLIDANALIEEANAEGAYDYVDAFQIANASTVDAVEVVRCKDCVVPHNKYTGCPELNGLVTPPDFYCPFGERKDGDDE